MAAPFKRTRTLSLDEIAAQVIAEIRKQLQAQNENVKEVKVDVCLYGHGARPFGSYLPNDYRDVMIKVGNAHWDGLDNYDVLTLKTLLDRSVKDFDNVERDDIFFGYGSFSADVENFPTTFRMLGKPCKAFNKLAKLVERKYGVSLKPTELYNVRLFGKSGRYGESGEREYVAFNESECNELIDFIKSFGRKRTTFAILNRDDIDTDYSARYLTECYGYRKRTISIER